MNPRAERRVWVLGTTGPALVFLVVVAYLPIAYAVALSFFKKTAFNPAMKWTGLDNYRLHPGRAGAVERLRPLGGLHGGLGGRCSSPGAGGRAPAEPGVPGPQPGAEPVRAPVPPAVHRGGAGLPVAPLAGVRRDQPGADADRPGGAADQLLRGAGHRDVGGHRHGGLAVRLVRHPPDPRAATGHQPQALRGRRRLGGGAPARLLGRHAARPPHHLARHRAPARHLDVQQVRLDLAGHPRRPAQAHRDPAALCLPPGLRGVRLRPGRGRLLGDVRGPARRARSIYFKLFDPTREIEVGR